MTLQRWEWFYIVKFCGPSIFAERSIISGFKSGVHLPGDDEGEVRKGRTSRIMIRKSPEEELCQ